MLLFPPHGVGARIFLARELEVGPNLIRPWRRKFAGVKPGKAPTTEQQEILDLQRQLSQVREERDILKKALAIFSDRRPGQFASTETLAISPLPCWDELPAEQIRERITELVREITAETRRRLSAAGARPLGRRRILRQNPHARPRRIARSAAPRFHAASWPIRRMLEAGYRSYLDAYREAKQTLAGQRQPVRFPSHGIPPPWVGLAVPARVAAARGLLAPLCPTARLIALSV